VPVFAGLGNVQKHDDVLDQRDWQFLRSAYLTIKGDPALEPVARDALFKKMLDRMAGSQRLRELCGEIWQPFSGKSAVIAINDRQQPRDAYPFQELIRHLSASGFETTFHTVSLRPELDEGQLNEQFAVSFIGRHTMYRDCAVLAEIPADLRFHLPKDNAAMRGQPLARNFTASRSVAPQPSPWCSRLCRRKESVSGLIGRCPALLGGSWREAGRRAIHRGCHQLGHNRRGTMGGIGRCDSIKLPAGLASRIPASGNPSQGPLPGI